MQKISVHNSASEFAETPERIAGYGFEELIFTGSSGLTLPYRKLVCNPELPGKYSLLIFFHGAGSVGIDNFLQMRLPALPVIKYVKERNFKAVILFPQCRRFFKWVNRRWDLTSHKMAEKPSLHLELAMELLEKESAAYDIGEYLTGGISMGSFGAWDLVSRLPERFSGIFTMCGGADVSQAPKLAHLRVANYHGAQDNVVPVCRSRDLEKALRAAGNDKLYFCELPEAAHNCWDAALADEKAWEQLFGRKIN